MQNPTSGVRLTVRNLRRLILRPWPHSQRGRLTTEYIQSPSPFQNSETRHQVVVSTQSPEPSPEHKCLLLFSKSSNSSCTELHLAEKMLSVAVMPYAVGYGNRKVGCLDPNLFSDWDPDSSPDSSISLPYWEHHCQQAVGDTGDEWVLSFGSCVTGKLGTQDLEHQEQ